MKNVRAVYTKLRDVKHAHLVRLYKKLLKRLPENCKYNYKYSIAGKADIRICLLHQPEVSLEQGIFPHLVDVCQDIQHCQDCNAFINLRTREDVQKLFDQKLENTKVKEKEYPDICALEWVLEQNVLGIPPLSTVQIIWYSIKKWLSKNKIL